MGGELWQLCEERQIVCACENGDWETLIDGTALLLAGEGYTSPLIFLGNGVELKFDGRISDSN
jgi:hypothetical protein